MGVGEMQSVAMQRAVFWRVVFDVHVGNAGEPDGSSVDDYRSDDEFVGGNYSFFSLTSVGASKHF